MEEVLTTGTVNMKSASGVLLFDSREECEKESVPVDFWEQATDELYKVKPIFMLAESEIPELVNNGSFAMDYAWEMHHLFNDIAKSQGINKKSKKLEKGNVVDASAKSDKKTALDIDRLLAEKSQKYTRGYQMQFTSNHDENAWAGTEMTRFGDGYEAFATLAANSGSLSSNDISKAPYFDFITS